MSQKKKPKERGHDEAGSVRAILWVAGLILALWTFYGVYAVLELRKARGLTVPGELTSVEEKRLGQLGQFGDMFGAVSSLVASFGFLGVAYTIYRQHVDGEKAEQRRRSDREAEEQRRRSDKELDDARAEAAEVRHREIVATEERIARITALRTVVDHAAAEMLIWERKLHEMAEISHPAIEAGYRMNRQEEFSDVRDSEDGAVLLAAYQRIFYEDPSRATTTGKVHEEIFRWREERYTRMVEFVKILKQREAAALAELNRLTGSPVPDLPGDWDQRWRTDDRPLRVG